MQAATFTSSRLGECRVVCVNGNTMHFARADRADEVQRHEGESFDAWVGRVDGHEVEIWRCDASMEVPR